MNMKDTYFAKMTSNFRRWDGDMRKLVGRSAQMEEGARAGYEQQLRTMRVRRDACYRKLQEIRSASESSWRRMQAGVDGGWASMRRSMQQATAAATAAPPSAGAPPEASMGEGELAGELRAEEKDLR
jgi:hypothetical protein